MTAKDVRDDDGHHLIGTWKLKSYEIEDKITGDKQPILGANPNGCLVFTADGWLIVVITGEGREPARSKEECVQWFKTMTAYSGKYRIEGDQFITRVDVSWNKWWNGMDHARHFKIEGNRLDILTAWEPIRPVLGSPLKRAIMSWQRAT
jgi:Lipocalin-like domain